jgi:hypothetical protein
MSQTNPELADLRRHVYDHRLTVNRLHRLIYGHEQPVDSPPQLEQLLQAQADLFALEQQLTGAERRAQQAAEKSAATSQPAERPVTRGGSVQRHTYDSSVTRSAETTGIDIEVQLQMAHVPTAIYHLFDPTKHPLLECKVSTVSSQKRRLRIISYIEGYSAKAVQSLELAAKDGAQPVRQLPTLFPDRVRTVRELTRATLNVLAEDLRSKEIEVHKTLPIWLLSRNSAPLAIKNPATAQWDDVSRYYAAFVTPNQEDVMHFLRTAADHHELQQLVGYQSGEPVIAQVAAIYSALQKAQIKYVNSLVDFNPDEGARTQRVRLPRECLKSQQANCIDGVLLFASLLEAISLNPAIVIVPKHAFVGWETGLGNNQWQYLETTMLGGNHPFEAALDNGTRRAAQYEAQQRQADAAGRAHELWFRRWSLRDLRTIDGITPME